MILFVKIFDSLHHDSLRNIYRYNGLTTKVSIIVKFLQQVLFDILEIIPILNELFKTETKTEPKSCLVSLCCVALPLT